MDAKIDIYGISGDVICSVLITKDAVSHEELMTSDYIQLSWNDDKTIVLPAGAYIIYQDEKYSLIEPYLPLRENEAEYKYTPQFHSRIMIWDKIPVPLYTYESDGLTIKSREMDWDFTGSPADAMYMVKQAIKNETGEDWTIQLSESLPATITISSQSNSIFSLLTSIANECKTEWWADKSTNVLYLSQCKKGTELTLKVGDNVGVPTVTQSKDGYYTRFYVFGSTRNITQDYQGGQATNHIVNKRLTLDPIKYPGGYKDTKGHFDNGVFVSDLQKGEVFIKTLYFDDVYPKSKLTISDVRARLKYRLDTNGNKVRIGGTDEEPVYEQYAIWYFQISGLNFDPSTIIEEKELAVSFESGQLAGRDFKLTYHEKASVVNDSADFTPFNVKAGDFEINIDESTGNIIPGMAYIIPQNGDDVILYNIEMPDEYVASAQEELELELDKEMESYTCDNNSYEFDSYPVSFYDNGTDLNIGQSVAYVNGDKILHTRVIMVEKRLDFSFQQRIRIGNEIIKGNTQQLKEEVANVNQNIDVIKAFNELSISLSNAYANAQREMIEGFAAIKDIWEFDNDESHWTTDDSGNKIKTIKSKFNVWSNGYVSALGASGSSLGGSFDLLQEWDKYVDETAKSMALSAYLGKDLLDRVTSLEKGQKGHKITISGSGNVLVNVAESNDGSTLTFTKGNIDLSGYATKTELTELLTAKADKSIRVNAGTGLTGGGSLSADITLSLATVGTAGTYTKVTVDKYGRVTGHSSLTAADIPTLEISKINGLQAELDKKLNKTDFGASFATEMAKWFAKDSDGNIYVVNEKGFYSNSFISALGLNNSEGGAGGTSYDRLDNWADYAEEKATWVLSAKLGNELNSRVSALEAGGATSVVTTGSGNAVTSITKSGTVITATKGSTFLLSSAYTAADVLAKLKTVDGSGSGLDADLLDGTHKSDLLTALSSSSATNLSLTVGGTTKTIADLYATQAANADTLDNVHLNGIFTGFSANGNSTRLVIGGVTKDLTVPYATKAGYLNTSQKSSGSLADIVNSGYLYYGGGSNTVEDKPSGVDAFGLFTMQTASGWHGQILMSSNTNTGLYWRTASTFNGGWKKLLDSSNYNEYSPTKTGGGASGTWGISISGNAASATKLATARTIWGQSFNGSANISGNLTGVGSISMSGGINGFDELNSSKGSGGRSVTISREGGFNLYATSSTGYAMGMTMYTNSDGSSLGTIAGAYGAGNTLTYFYYGGSYSSPKMVIKGDNVGIGTTSPSYKLDVNGSVHASSFVGSLSGNADTATELQTPRTINGTYFSGVSNITTSYWGLSRNIYIQDATEAHTGAAVSVNGSANVNLKLPSTITATLVGNASSATKLATARTLWGRSFDGTENVSGSLSGVGTITGSGTLALVGNDDIYLKRGGADNNSLVLAANGFRPFSAANNNIDLGSSSAKWRNLYVAGTANVGSITIGSGKITWDSTKNCFHFSHGLYSDSFVSALGANSSASGGGGSYERLDSWSDYSSDKATWVLSALLGHELNSRVSALEAGGATSVVTTGSGNVVTAVAKSGTVITATKGITALTSHQAIYALTLQGNGSTIGTFNPKSANATINLTAKNLLLGRGLQNPQTGRTQNFGRLYSYYTSGSAHENAPTTYTAVIGFGGDSAASVEIAGGWTSGMGLWYRALRDVEDDWFGWRKVLDESNYASVLDSRYYTESEINTKLTNGSVTKVGTASVGSTVKPIYLNGGVPTALSANAGNSTHPVYLNAGAITQCGSTLDVSISGTAAKATALATARTINDVSFNGTANIRLTSMYTESLSGKTLSLDSLTLESGTPHVKWYLCPTDGGGSGITDRPDDNAKNAFTLQCEIIRWASSADYITKQVYTQGSTRQTWMRFIVKGTATEWARVLDSLNYTSYTVTKTGSGASGTWGIGISGNAATASKLATARTINGTNFDGSANITTSYWGTSRNIYIQDATAAHTGAAVSVNGSGNINLKLPSTITAALTGNASTASKWQTARTVTMNGFADCSFNIDGSANVNFDFVPYNFRLSVGNKNNYPWHRIAKIGTISSSYYYDAELTLLLSQGYDGGYVGIVRIILRTNNTSTASSAKAEWLLRKGFAADSVKIGIYNVFSSTYADVFLHSNGTYAGTTGVVLTQGFRGYAARRWTLVDSSEVSDTTTSDKLTSYECWASIESAATDLHGKAYSQEVTAADSATVKTANQFTTARNINGTAFNGTADITTAKWGTARNIYIRDASQAHTGAAVSVDGSATEYLLLPSTITATLSGNASTATKLQTARTLWGRSFDGSANVSGDMTGVGNVTPSANGTLDLGTATSRWANMYTNCIEVYGTNPVIRFHYNNSSSVTDFIGAASNGLITISNVLRIYQSSGVYVDKGNLCVAGKVVIGSTSITPSYDLTVLGDIGIKGTNGGMWILPGYASGEAFRIDPITSSGTSNSNRITLLQNGNICIGGPTTTSYKLDVSGTIYSRANIIAAGAVTALVVSSSSDARLKNIIRDACPAVEDVADAPAVEFAWKKDGSRAVGSIAQYWQGVLPQAVHEERGYLAMQYDVIAMLASIANARRILSIEKKIRELEAEVKRLKTA